MACIQLGLPQTTLWNKRPDWTFDGADEVDPQNNLIKGRGGAMFKEKLLIKSSGKTYIIIDESKLVSKLGSKYPIPVEVFPHALSHVENEIRLLGASKSAYALQKEKTARYLPKTVISFLTFISATLFLIWNRN